MSKKSEATIITIDAGSIAPSSFNPKRTQFYQKEAQRLGLSIDKYGQLLPLLVRELANGTYEIVNGHHRFAEMQKKGMTKIECWNLGKVSESKAKAIILSLEDSKIPLNRLKVADLVDGVSNKSLFAYLDDDLKTLRALKGLDFKESEEKAAQKKAYKVAIPEDRYLEWDTKKAGRTDDEFLLVLLERGLAQLK